jgi:hypothetical protein
MKLVLLGLLLLPGLASGQEPLDCHLVPGWEQTGQPRQYTPDNLFDYRDGAAEGYLQFGFTRMRGVDCKAGAMTLAVDISDMADPEMAYGMFSANRDPRVAIVHIGMSGQVQHQGATFAKGNFYVELVITGAASNANLSQVLQQFAAGIAGRLTGTEASPEALSWFPADDLEEVRLMPESVLGLSVLKRGYVAKYKRGQAFIVREESPQAAAAVMTKLRARWQGTSDAALADESFQGKVPYLDGMCVFRKGRTIGGFANAPSPEEAKVQAAKLLAKVP